MFSVRAAASTQLVRNDDGEAFREHLSLQKAAASGELPAVAAAAGD